MTDTADREIADLLPWYETGRLGAEDRARVEAALARDPALRSELALVREEMAATVTVNEALGAPSRKASEDFFTKLDASPRRRTRFDLARFSASGFLAEKLAALRPRTLAWGAMAAFALVLVQGGLITTMMSGSSGTGGYQTASAPKIQTSAGPTLLVAFAPGATAGAIETLLADNGLTIVGGPAAGFFTLAVPRDLPAAKVEELIARLKEHKDVMRSVMLQAAPD